MGIKLGLVGLGSFGSAFAALFKSHPLVDKIALCDAEEGKLKRWAEHPGIQDKLDKSMLYTSLDEICKAELDALVIITQPWLHAPQCIQAMEHGKDVYSAVPVVCLPDFDETMDWCGKIMETSLRTGKHYMLGETTIYRPQTMLCRRQAAVGAFGNFVFTEGEYAHDVDLAGCSLREVRKSRKTGHIGSQAEEFFEQYRKRGMKSSPMSYPTHSISGPMNVMKTFAKRVSAIGYRNRNNDPFFADDEFSDVTAFFHLANGASLRIAEYREISENTGLQGEDFRLFGTRGSYSYGEFRDNGRTEPTPEKKENKGTKYTEAEMRDPLPVEFTKAIEATYRKAAPLIAEKHPERLLSADFTLGGHGGSHAYLVDDFCRSVAENRNSRHCNIWEAAKWMAAGTAAHKSAMQDGELVDVPYFGEAPSL